MEQARQVQVAAAGPSRLEFLAASTMCRLQAEACNVDRDDLWKLHSDEFYADARQVLEAIGAAELVRVANNAVDDLDAALPTLRTAGWQTHNEEATIRRARAAIAATTGASQ